jgi:hypothetical protein
MGKHFCSGHRHVTSDEEILRRIDNQWVAREIELEDVAENHAGEN